MINNLTINVLHSALNGLSARQQAISDDIANVNTPFFRGRQVQFENDLKAAIAYGDDPLTVTPRVQFNNAPAGLNGNNVNLEDETVASVQTQLRYELALRAAGDRFSILRSAARGV